MTSSDHLPPLESIRRAERDCAQLIRATQADAEERKVAARREASRLTQEAAARGRQQGEHDYRAAMDAAHQEAQRMVDQAHTHASHLLRNSETYSETMVDQALEIIRGFADP